MRPVLEDPAGAEQLRDRRGRVGADPGREREPVAPVDGGDRVELDAREACDRILDLRCAAAPKPAGVALCGNRDPADRCGAHRRFCGHPRVILSDRATTVSTVQSFEEFLREWLPAPPARVLEVGCGQGRLTTALAIAGHDVVGIDPVAPEGDLFRRLTLDDLDESERYDAVVAAYSLHHIRDLDVALGKIATHLDAGGVLVVDEFAWDLLDEPTLDWFWGQRRALAAAGNEPAPAGPEELRAEWDADHLGLHGYESLRRALDERFEELVFVRVPYLHRLLGDVSTAVLEQELVDAETIRPLGFRYAGRAAH